MVCGKGYCNRFDGYIVKVEMIALRTPKGDFHVLLTSGHDNPWMVFSSATSTWTEADWPTTSTDSSTIFLDPDTQKLYYHINGETFWRTIEPKSK